MSDLQSARSRCSSNSPAVESTANIALLGRFLVDALCRRSPRRKTRGDSFQRRVETESGFWGGNRMPTRSMSSLQSGVIAATPVRRNEVARMCAVLARSPIGLRDQKSQNKFRSNLRRAASEPRRRNDINLDPILRRLDIAKPTGRNHAFGGVDLIRVKRFRTVTRD